MRRALTGLVLSGALLSSSTTVAAAAGPVVVRSDAYGSHPRQTVTVYGDRGPALVILHGGYWARDTDWSGWARWFAERGFTVYDTEYRLNSDAPWPAQREDALAALDWVAARHDGARPLLLGSSAGGQIATVTGAYGAGADLVRGVVALSPVAAPYRAWLDGARDEATPKQQRLRQEAARLAGCVPGRDGDRCWEQWNDMTAHTHASGAADAPLLLVHSAGDFVPPEHSKELASVQEGLGHSDVTVRVEAGSRRHGAQLLGIKAVRDAVLDWLREHA